MNSSRVQKSAPYEDSPVRLSSSRFARALDQRVATFPQFLAFKALSRGNLVFTQQLTTNDQWTGPTRLFAVSNVLGWFAAGTDSSIDRISCHQIASLCSRITDIAIILSPLAHLREAFKSSKTAFSPRVTVTLTAKPTSLAFTNNQECLVVADLHGGINVFDTTPLQNTVHIHSHLHFPVTH
jgi:hypothetical protein